MLVDSFVGVVTIALEIEGVVSRIVLRSRYTFVEAPNTSEGALFKLDY